METAWPTDIGAEPIVSFDGGCVRHFQSQAFEFESESRNTFSGSVVETDWPIEIGAGTTDSLDSGCVRHFISQK